MIPVDFHRAQFVPDSEVSRRLSELKKNLNAEGVAAAWIENTADILYYSGSAQQGVLLVPADGDPIPYFRKSLKRAEAESPLDVQPFPGSKSLFKKTAGLISGKGPLGVMMDVLSASKYLWMKGKLETVEFADIAMAVRLQRAVKSEWELAQIREAAGQADRVFSEIGNYIKPGITELELTGMVEARLRQLGHSGALRIRGGNSALAMIMAVSGDSALYPTNFDGPGGGPGPGPAAPAGSGWKMIARNETVMLDIVSDHNGYHSDQTRIFFTGTQIPEEAVKAHRFCVDVLERVQLAMKPGRICQDIYEEVNQWVQDNGPPEGFMGYSENRVKFFGHGVGIELDEFPIIADRIQVELKPGMAVAVEPKGFLKGIGAVGGENTFIIGREGGQPVNSASLEIVKV